MAMNWRQIETSRERRLWLGQVFIPLAAVVMANPETRTKVVNFVSTGATKVKNAVTDTCRKVQSKFGKKKEEEESPCTNCEYGKSIFDCLHNDGDVCKKGIYSLHYDK